MPKLDIAEQTKLNDWSDVTGQSAYVVLLYISFFSLA